MFQCTFWCSVLSDCQTGATWRTSSTSFNAPFGAQCFPTNDEGAPKTWDECFNAPFGAQCFPTLSLAGERKGMRPVSMHLLVLSAFRPGRMTRPGCGVRVSMHLLVLSAFRRGRACASVWACRVSMHLLVLSAFRPAGPEFRKHGVIVFQCTFWCSVLSDRFRTTHPGR